MTDPFLSTLWIVPDLIILFVKFITAVEPPSDLTGLAVGRMVGEWAAR